MSRSPSDRQSPNRFVRAAFAVLALLSILVGLLLYQFADSLGFDKETTEIIAIAFLIAGVGDYVVLHFWDRIFRKPNH